VMLMKNTFFWDMMLYTLVRPFRRCTLPQSLGWFKRSVIFRQCLLVNSAKFHKNVIPSVSYVLTFIIFYCVMSHKPGYLEVVPVLILL
jgi:hypothetical protein